MNHACFAALLFSPRPFQSTRLPGMLTSRAFSIRKNRRNLIQISENRSSRQVQMLAYHSEALEAKEPHLLGLRGNAVDL